MIPHSSGPGKNGDARRHANRPPLPRTDRPPAHDPLVCGLDATLCPGCRAARPRQPRVTVEDALRWAEAEETRQRRQRTRAAAEQTAALLCDHPDLVVDVLVAAAKAFPAVLRRLFRALVRRAAR